MPQKKRDTKVASADDIKSLKKEIEHLSNEAEELQRKVYRLRIRKDVLENTTEIIKKEEGVNLDKLTNREKAIVIGALYNKYKLLKLLDVLRIPKSNCCYQQASLKATDKYSKLLKKIQTVFDNFSSRYDD